MFTVDHDADSYHVAEAWLARPRVRDSWLTPAWLTRAWLTRAWLTRAASRVDAGGGVGFVPGVTPWDKTVVNNGGVTA